MKKNILESHPNLLRLGIVLMVSLLTDCTSASLVTPTPSAMATLPLPAIKRIAFVVTPNDGSKSDIYVINADGSQLTHLAEKAAYPVWSPNGLYIAFISSNGVQMMNADGNNRVQLAYDSDLISNLAWSPDGQQIIFSSSKEDNAGEIYLINIEESVQGKPGGQTRLNRQGVDARNITWSPDGEWIVFSYRYNIHDSYEIAVLNIEEALQSTEGGEWTTLTEGENPAWSPDGQHIIFESGSSDNQGIYLMDVSGSPPLLLANNAAYPAWSPDGQHIAFVSYPEDNLEIYVMDADGNHQIRLTNNSTIDLYPSWSPDGQQIAFVSSENGEHWAIYVMDVDGSNLIRLTNTSLWQRIPMWEPR